MNISENNRLARLNEPQFIEFLAHSNNNESLISFARSELTFSDKSEIHLTVQGDWVIFYFYKPSIRCKYFDNTNTSEPRTALYIPFYSNKATYSCDDIIQKSPITAEQFMAELEKQSKYFAQWILFNQIL